MASSVCPCDLVFLVSKALSSAALLCCVIEYNYLLPLLACKLLELGLTNSRLAY